MPHFLLIETASNICSVAVARDEVIVAQQYSNQRNHAAALAPMIQDVLQQAGLAISQLDCIGINGGPGSYTGLRIGLSTAKGMCFAANKPLIMIDALTVLANGVTGNLTNGLVGAIDNDEIIIATVDNRRDELFFAVFDAQLKRVQDVTLTEASSEELRKHLTESGDTRLGGKRIVIGSAIEKLSKVFPENETLRYDDVKPSAVNLLNPVLSSYRAQQFADLAYSEPFYYKDVYIAPKKLRQTE